MVSGTLYTTPTSAKGATIKATAALAGIDIKVASDYKHFEDNKKPEYLSKFPHGKIPALEMSSGFKVFEGLAIAKYIASLAPNSGLLGHSPEDETLINQWLHLADTEVDVTNDVISMMVDWNHIPYNKAAHTYFQERMARALTTLDQHLLSRTFFVGERITLADIAIAQMVQRAAWIAFDAPLRKKLPNIVRHSETIINQPKIKEFFVVKPYVEKPLQYVPPKKEEKPKAAKEEKPKAEKKPKAKVDDEEDEPAVPAEPKAKNPLDDLPKSSFNLEDWKRAYSNKDTRGAGGAIEWFYQNFDKEGFSVWRVDFKYNTELTQTFMSSNQIGGFFNRLEASRKYLFGSVGVLGKTNDSVIAGTLILRGQDAIPVVNVAPDYESYEFKKLDVFGNEADKKFFEAALAWDLDEGGKAWVDGKNFK